MELDNAQKDTLSYIATGGGLAQCGLSLAQVNVAKKQLEAGGLVAPSNAPEAVDGYVLTREGKAVRAALRAKGDAF